MAGSQIVLGILQSNSYLASGPLVVFLWKSRRECFCSGPSAGKTCIDYIDEFEKLTICIIFETSNQCADVDDTCRGRL